MYSAVVDPLACFLVVWRVCGVMCWKRLCSREEEGTLPRESVLGDSLNTKRANVVGARIAFCFFVTVVAWIFPKIWNTVIGRHHPEVPKQDVITPRFPVKHTRCCCW